MKFKFRQLAFTLVLCFAAFIHPEQTVAQQGDVNFQVFYDALSPYGQWVDYQNYGYVWVPDVGSDFVPYSTSGYWVLTDYGWTWVSDYEWGWAPFHYGRWNYDNSYGWLWVPGNEWGPSWVNWRRSDGYYGWSPMQSGISLSIGFNQSYNSNYDHWMFVSDNDFERHDIHRYFIGQNDRDRIVRNSTVINTTYIDNRRHSTYVTGPARDEVQRVTGRRINQMAIQDNNKPAKDLNNGQLNIYRPQIKKENASGHRPSPVQVVNIKDVKKASERRGTPQQRGVNQQNNGIVPAAPVRNATPLNDRAKQQQMQVPKSQNNNRTQPAQPDNRVSPANKPGINQPSNQVKPQNSNTRVAPSQQPQRVTPANNNNSQTKQQPKVTPANNNVRQAQPAQQPHHATPANNNVRQQQSAPRPQNNINKQPTSQPPAHVNPPAKRAGPQQQNSVRPQTEKPKENRSAEEKR